MICLIKILWTIYNSYNITIFKSYLRRKEVQLLFGSENVITKTRIFVDAEKYAIRQWVELDKLLFQIQVTYKGNTLKPCMAKCFDGYQFVVLIIASGIVNNDNQNLKHAWRWNNKFQEAVLYKRISKRTNPVSSHPNSSIFMAGMNPTMAKILWSTWKLFYPLVYNTP
jgi:hypothetical protein